MQVITTPSNTPNIDLYIHFHLLLVNTQSKAAVAYFNTLRTGDADLRLYITTVQDG